jgi:hypothetical protein
VNLWFGFDNMDKQSGAQYMKLTMTAISDLAYAKQLLEKQSFTEEIINVVGVPFEQLFKLLPEKYSNKIQKISENAMDAALNCAVLTMADENQKHSSDMLHKIAVAATGGLGGAFGLPALAIELPISTTIMLRSIADIARGEGENINQVETKLACLTVFALGGKADNTAVETSYYAVRTALSKAISEAAKYISEKGILEQGVPILMRFVAKVASRFGMVVSQKAAATAIPIAGAVGGVTINTLFIHHFQNMARGHFTIRRLERKYGEKTVKAEYERLSMDN